jgi:ABC-type transporter Mla MlaB component
MFKEDFASGLLSKLVKFVRNPATSWSELDALEADKDDSVNKQLLKEMMERKRRNDFVRKREFDMLRKLRKLEAVSGQNQNQDPAGKPSFFQSSMISPDERASTLKKIDEIEAQMSMQWWKNKDLGAGGSTLHSADIPLTVGLTQPPKGRAEESLAYMTTIPTQAVSAARMAELTNDPMVNPAAAKAAPPAQADASAGFHGSYATSLSGLLPMNDPLSAPLEQDMVGHDADLEEAAILFANGDDAGAEAGLLELLAPGALRADHVNTWLTLFDLYRATGEQEKFEAAALQFLKRFDRSAPQWFCLPDMMKALFSPSDKASNGSSIDWICPSIMGLQTVAALNAAMARNAMPWRLDWSNLKSIDPSALEPLNKVFAGWVAQPVQLQFQGQAKLQDVLLTATPSGNRETDQKWWLLRMQALRVMNLSDDFEMAALDFCITYEVSPPAWTKACCICTSLDAQGNAVGSQTIISEPVHSMTLEAEDSNVGPASSTMNHQLFSVELSGHIQGDAIGVLDRLEAKLTGASMVQISCAKLIRVDFSAAGMLLNWVSARQAEQRTVKFSEVNRLVAAFFNVIGITEYAKVVVRVD